MKKALFTLIYLFIVMQTLEAHEESVEGGNDNRNI